MVVYIRKEGFRYVVELFVIYFYFSFANIQMSKKHNKKNVGKVPTPVSDAGKEKAKSTGKLYAFLFDM